MATQTASVFGHTRGSDSPGVGGIGSVLVITNMYPTSRSPESGAFVEAQVQSLRRRGVDARVLHVRRDEQGRGVYRKLPEIVRAETRTKRYALIHVMYGGVMAHRVVMTTALPKVVSFCGTDLNGLPRGHPWERISAWQGVRASSRAALRADGIIVKSRRLAAKLPPGVDMRKVSIIANGVDLSRFRRLDRDECRKMLGWENDRHHVVFYGRGAWKRPDLAREATARAAADGLEVELHELSGIVHDDVPIWINACEALLCLSAMEGSPNTVKEALACDVPVIATDAGDIRERIEAIPGCHVIPPDSEKIAAAINQACRDGGRVEGTPAVRDLSTEAVAARVIDVYKAVLARYNMGAAPAQSV